MPGVSDESIYKKDVSFIRHKLEEGETPHFIIKADDNLIIKAALELYDGVIYVKVWPEYRITDDSAWVVEEPATFELTGFIENNEVA